MANNSNTRHQQLRLLSLDGGGVRGLSSLYILRHLMMVVNSRNPPKPCQFFHMIGGTSTGGIIAIMLGRLEMGIDDCIEAYSTMMDKVFKKKARLLSLNGDLQARFDTAELERCIKDVVKTYGIGKDENMLFQDRKLGCKVFVCSSQRLVAEDVVKFSTYQREYEAFSEMFETAKVWEVCRATAAATTFFDSINITCGTTQVEFLDGATRANNPVNELWDEAKEVFGADFATRLQCVVSIGNGVAESIDFGRSALETVKALKQLAVETKAAHVSFLKNHPELTATRYYRLNVAQGLSGIGLEDASKRGAILSHTKAYLNEHERREVLKRFKDTVTQSVQTEGPQAVPATAAPRPITPPRPPRQLQPAHPASQSFLTLGRESRWVNHKPRVEPDHYWSRLTLHSLQVYASIYKAMCDPSTGLVDAARFQSYFARLNPMPRELADGKLVRQIWARLPLEGPDPGANRDVTMAALFMVHMETHVNDAFRPNFSPKHSGVFSYHRAKFVWRYANWVRCACGCGRMWSFANGLEGLTVERNMPDKSRACLAVLPDGDGKGGSKGVLGRWFGVTSSGEKKVAKALKLFNVNRLDWNRLQSEEERTDVWSSTF